MDPQDLFVLLCYALRYSLGRNDGSVLTFERMAQKYAPRLTQAQRDQLVSEIGEKVHAAALVSDVFGSIEVQRGWETIAGYLAKVSGDSTYPSVQEIEYMKQGRTLDAIRSARQRSSFGLREAKDLVDMWRAHPSKYGLI